jgi:chromosome segregation ATPase
MASPQDSLARVNRRRQRSTRLVVATALLCLAALAVAGAVASGSSTLVVLAAVLGVLLGAAATRITHAELVATRRAAARDRAEQAQAYREITAARTAENAAFATAMRERVDRQQVAIHDLEDALGVAQRRAADAARKFNAEARRAEVAEREGEQLGKSLAAAEERAAEAIVRVAELEQELDVVRAELDVVTEAWQAAEAAQRRHA